MIVLKDYPKSLAFIPPLPFHHSLSPVFTYSPAPFHLPASPLHSSYSPLQDDTFSETFISTIGVDFVSSYILCNIFKMAATVHFVCNCTLVHSDNTQYCLRTYVAHWGDCYAGVPLGCCAQTSLLQDHSVPLLHTFRITTLAFTVSFFVLIVCVEYVGLVCVQCVCSWTGSVDLLLTSFLQKIKTVELDGKIIKLQIVSGLNFASTTVCVHISV